MSGIHRLLASSWEDALHCLAFERSRAPSFPVALRRWAAGQRTRSRRLLALGAQPAGRLQRAEWLAWRLGFAPTTALDELDPGVVAPWHFPASALTQPLTAWLRHPLIDPVFLAQPGANPESVELQSLVDLLEACLAEVTLQEPSPTRRTSLATGTKARVAVVLHLFYPELWPEFFEALSGFREPWDLYITVPAFVATPWLDRIVREAPGVSLFRGPNRGRDVLPWLRLARSGKLDDYELVCKLHTKRSPHMADGARWRRSMLEGLLGEPEALAQKLVHLRADPSIGVAGPANLRVEATDARWMGSSAASVAKAASILGFQAHESRRDFIAGTMFWYRPPALRRLVESCGRPNLFEPEMAQTDGTFAHGIERLIGSAALAQGYRLADLPVR